MIVPPFSSCSGDDYFFIMSFNPCYLTKGGGMVLWVEGGVPPYTWEIDEADPCFWFSTEGGGTGGGGDELALEDGFGVDMEDGDGVALEGEGGRTSSEQWIIINANETCDYTANPYYSETIKVRDACGTELEHEVYLCDIDICCDDPNYSFSYDLTSALYVERGTYAEVRVIGGCPPYHWEVSGDDFMFPEPFTNDTYNLIYALPGEGNATGVIKVTDDCAEIVGDNELTAYEVDGLEIEIAAGLITTDEDPEGAGVCGDTNYDFYWEPVPTSDDEADAPDGSATIYISGGLRPYVWSLNGTGWTFEAGSNIKWKHSPHGYENGDRQTIYNQAPICNPSKNDAILTVADRCLQLASLVPGGAPSTWSVTPICCCDVTANPSWASGNPTTIDRGAPGTPEQAAVLVEDGCGPFTWTVSGTGFWLDAACTLVTLQTAGRGTTIYADDTACGMCDITVEESCPDGGSCTGQLRCTTGSWSKKDEGTIGFGWGVCGVALSYPWTEIISGNKKWKSSLPAWNSCWEGGTQNETDLEWAGLAAENCPPAGCNPWASGENCTVGACSGRIIPTTLQYYEWIC